MGDGDLEWLFDTWHGIHYLRVRRMHITCTVPEMALYAGIAGSLVGKQHPTGPITCYLAPVALPNRLAKEGDSSHQR